MVLKCPCYVGETDLSLAVFADDIAKVLVLRGSDSCEFVKEVTASNERLQSDLDQGVSKLNEGKQVLQPLVRGGGYAQATKKLLDGVAVPAWWRSQGDILGLIHMRAAISTRRDEVVFLSRVAPAFSCDVLGGCAATSSRSRRWRRCS